MTVAADWLSQVLANGPASSASLKALASAAGISSKRLRRAREQLGVIHARYGCRRTMCSNWSLPFVYTFGGRVVHCDAYGPAGEMEPGRTRVLPLSPQALTQINGDRLLRIAMMIGVREEEIARCFDSDPKLSLACVRQMSRHASVSAASAVVAVNAAHSFGVIASSNAAASSRPNGAPGAARLLFTVAGSAKSRTWSTRPFTTTSSTSSNGACGCVRLRLTAAWTRARALGFGMRASLSAARSDRPSQRRGLLCHLVLTFRLAP